EADYSKAIDEAIDNTKHMIVVSSNLSYIKEKWVKHEWSTFCDDLKGGYRDGNIITILSEAIQLKDLPASIRHKQSFTFNNYKQHILHYLRQDEDATQHRQVEEPDTLEKAKEYYKKWNFANAVMLFRKAAEQGSAEAQWYLGDCYYNGNGVDENETEAVKWFRIAAEQGYAPAQLRMGECYEDGEGVNENYEEAVKWYRLAAEQNYTLAQLALGRCYYNGNGVAQNYAEAAKWYQLLAEQGDVEAQVKLGFCYYDGEGVNKDLALAELWWKRAVAQGSLEAQSALENLL
ncbi:MAG: sel1 repeat family protein, partial [Muribaculaceae bacterium]|nr:sel1 repeat family protein [Muribaculaceae bacterium]